MGSSYQQGSTFEELRHDISKGPLRGRRATRPKRNNLVASLDETSLLCRRVVHDGRVLSNSSKRRRRIPSPRAPDAVCEIGSLPTTKRTAN
jgi:hypothetical protein